MIEAGRYTSGRIAIANLSAAIASLELRRREGASFDDLVALAKLLFARGDVLGRVKDHERAEMIGTEAVAMSPASAHALYVRAQLAGRFHRFEEASAVLDQALAAGYPQHEIDLERAALLQAIGLYTDALNLRGQLAKRDPGIQTLGGLASLLADMGQMERRRQHLCGGARCRQQRVTAPVRSTAVRVGRERDAPRRVGPRRGNLYRPGGSSARAHSGTGTSRRSGPRPRPVGCCDGAHHAVASNLGRSGIRRHLRGDPVRARGPQSGERSGTCRNSLRAVVGATARSVCRPRRSLFHGRRQETAAGARAGIDQSETPRHTPLPCTFDQGTAQRAASLGDA